MEVPCDFIMIRSSFDEWGRFITRNIKHFFCETIVASFCDILKSVPLNISSETKTKDSQKFDVFVDVSDLVEDFFYSAGTWLPVCHEEHALNWWAVNIDIFLKLLKCSSEISSAILWRQSTLCLGNFFGSTYSSCSWTKLNNWILMSWVQLSNLVFCFQYLLRNLMEETTSTSTLVNNESKMSITLLSCICFKLTIDTFNICSINIFSTM